MDFGIFNLMGYPTAGASTRENLEDTAVFSEIGDRGASAGAFAEHHLSVVLDVNGSIQFS